jgi:cytoskeletal protein RodZ
LLFGLTKLGVLVLGAETLGVGAATAGASSRDGVGLTGREPQATKNRDREISKLPKMDEPRSFFMGLILLEALLALVLLVLIVWWTMFSGRKKGELITKEDVKSNKQKDVEGS